jgi:hypothetical protein
MSSGCLAAAADFVVEPVEKVHKCFFHNLLVVLRYHFNQVGFEKSIVTHFSRSLFRELQKRLLERTYSTGSLERTKLGGLQHG